MTHTLPTAGGIEYQKIRRHRPQPVLVWLMHVATIRAKLPRKSVWAPLVHLPSGVDRWCVLDAAGNDLFSHLIRIKFAGQRLQCIPVRTEGTRYLLPVPVI